MIKKAYKKIKQNKYRIQQTIIKINNKNNNNSMKIKMIRLLNNKINQKQLKKQKNDQFKFNEIIKCLSIYNYNKQYDNKYMLS